jgi:hypothetical protein
VFKLGHNHSSQLRKTLHTTQRDGNISTAETLARFNVKHDKFSIDVKTFPTFLTALYMQNTLQ